MRRWFLHSALVLSGCALSHSPGTDGGAEDVGRVDAPADAMEGDRPVPDGSPPCGMRHGHQVCGSGCPCPAEKICDEELAVCINSHDGCYFVDDERYPRATFCRDGEFCALGLDQSGECYTAELCLAEELNCIYYDRTRLIDGPPVDGVTCPSGTANFCGEACGHEPCEINPFVPTSRASCIGIDEEHAIGVCALHTNTSCRPSFDFNENCELAFGQRCACLIDLREGPPRFGWITLEADCLAYRALRGDRFDCFDNTWSSI